MGSRKSSRVFLPSNADVVKNRKIKVLFVTPTLGGGGAEMHLARLIAGMDRGRFDVVVACFRAGGSYESKIPHGVPIVHLCPRWIRSSLLSAYAAILPLAALVRNERPDVVCSFLPHATGVLQAAMSLIRSRARLVVGIQNNPQVDSSLVGLPFVPLKSFYRRGLQQARKIVALSKGVYGAFVALHPEFAHKLSWAFNIGFDEAVLNGAQAKTPQEKPVVPVLVACGRLTRQKDYPTLLRAFCGIMNEQAAELWILGRGPLLGVLKAEAEALGISGHVRFLGFQPNPYAFMAQADCFVLSSAWEGFGNVIVEAMACGVPVVSTKCPFGPEEIIEEGVTGHLVEVGDDVALASRVLKILRDPALRGRIKLSAKDRARDFSPERIVPIYETIFTEAAS